MNDKSQPRDDEVVDVTVESPAARAREAQAAEPAERASRTRKPARRSHTRAWIVALLADAVQLGLAPLFVPGVFAPWNDALDLVVAALLVRWLGWHWALLPTLIAELIPGLGLVPTWTLAVWIATREGGKPPAAK